MALKARVQTENCRSFTQSYCVGIGRIGLAIKIPFIVFQPFSSKAWEHTSAIVSTVSTCVLLVQFSGTSKACEFDL